MTATIGHITLLLPLGPRVTVTALVGLAIGRRAPQNFWTQSSFWTIDDQPTSTADSTQGWLNPASATHPDGCCGELGAAGELKGSSTIWLCRRGLWGPVSELKSTPWITAWLCHVWTDQIWSMLRKCRLCPAVRAGESHHRWVLCWVLVLSSEHCW